MLGLKIKNPENLFIRTIAPELIDTVVKIEQYQVDFQYDKMKYHGFLFKKNNKQYLMPYGNSKTTKILSSFYIWEVDTNKKWEVSYNG